MRVRALGDRVALVSDGRLTGRVRVPPSKSYTHRASLMAGLSFGESRISNPLVSRDTQATFSACLAMGASVDISEGKMTIKGCKPNTPDDVVNVENSGTTLRFMTSVFSLADRGFTVLTGDSSIRRRPMQPLLDALAGLGVRAWSTRNNGCAPVVVEAGGMKGGETRVGGGVSSQFVSSLIISAPLAGNDSVIEVTDPVSRPYVDATLQLSRLFGVNVDREGYSRFRISGGQEYHANDFTVPGDFSSASFPLAAAAMVGGGVEVEGLSTSLPQGDSAIIGILDRMGARVSADDDSVKVEADGSLLRGGSFDLSDTPDLLPVVSVLALKCKDAVELKGVSHARFKETDRIRVLAEGLSKIGAKVEERPDGMTISGGRQLKRALLDGRGDHRMFMAFALASLLVPGGIPVSGAGSLDVSYPGFLRDMQGLGAVVSKQ